MFECQYCGKRRASSDHKKRHENLCRKRPIHLRKTHPCQYCGELFTRNHTKIDHEKNICTRRYPNGPQKRYPCQYCGELFTRAFSRDTHEKNSCKNNPNGLQKSYPCHYCGKVLSTNFARNRHQKESCEHTPLVHTTQDLRDFMPIEMPAQRFNRRLAYFCELLNNINPTRDSTKPSWDCYALLEQRLKNNESSFHAQLSILNTLDEKASQAPDAIFYQTLLSTDDDSALPLFAAVDYDYSACINEHLSGLQHQIPSLAPIALNQLPLLVSNPSHLSQLLNEKHPSYGIQRGLLCLYRPLTDLSGHPLPQVVVTYMAYFIDSLPKQDNKYLYIINPQGGKIYTQTSDEEIADYQQANPTRIELATLDKMQEDGYLPHLAVCNRIMPEETPPLCSPMLEDTQLVNDDDADETLLDTGEVEDDDDEDMEAGNAVAAFI